MRMFVVGDIHGCFDELMAALDAVGFDKAEDRLFALGDLVDRGPRSADVVRLLREPWFKSIMGNHEEMMVEAFGGESSLHVINGGGWFATLPHDERAELVDLVKDLPVCWTVMTPSGRLIGLVHANVVGDDWGHFSAAVTTPAYRDYAMWSRDRFREVRRGVAISEIRGVDHVYFGHTPVREPMRAANMSWIDTGCFVTGKIWVEELL